MTVKRGMDLIAKMIIESIQTGVSGAFELWAR
jgi:hypothetical protein